MEGKRTIVAGEFVMKVVVSLAKGNYSSDEVVSRCPSVVKRLFADPVSQRVDTESGLLNEACAEDACVDESSPPVAPAETGNQHRKEPR